jgi:hypothetical protein
MQRKPIFSMQKEDKQTDRHDEAKAHSSQIFYPSYTELNIKGQTHERASGFMC